MIFRPKLADTFSNYSSTQFYKDMVAGIIVGIVALPLAIAFAIASGVSPEKGIITAVVAGFIISAVGGSRVQIGGPTGAFIVIVYGIVQQYGINGLIIATFLAGVLLIAMGVARLGNVIKFIPYPVITGFTSGIAVIIFSSEMKDFFGLAIENVPVDFIDKWSAYLAHASSVNLYATGTALLSVVIILFWPKLTHKIPGSIIAILMTTGIVYYFRLPVATIGSRFGTISASFPSLVVPEITWKAIQPLVQPAVTIALLGAIESLLSAVVADGMTGGNHRSNTELIAQGTANVFSSLFGGIPATGAIARTATNIRNGGRTPVAGIVHALTLLLILLFIGKWVAFIPMPTLAGILVIVAYNMSEWQSFKSILNGPKHDAAVLLVTFLLTILIDLTVAIEIGMILATFLFMRQMVQLSSVNMLSKEAGINSENLVLKDCVVFDKRVQVFEITGPLFFGAVYKFKDAMRLIENPPQVLILRMEKVTVIDATGIRAIQEFQRMSKLRGVKLILSEVMGEQVRHELKMSRLLFAIGKANVTASFSGALERANTILKEITN